MHYEDFDELSPRVLNNPLKITETNERRIVDFYLSNFIEDITDYIDFFKSS